MLYFIVFANPNSRRSATDPLLFYSARFGLGVYPGQVGLSSLPYPVPPAAPCKILLLNPRKPAPFALPARKTQNPLLCFQSLAHSSAIRWGWGAGCPDNYRLAPPEAVIPSEARDLLFLSPLPSGSLTPLFATLTKSSILRSPQPLCLPLLRKLPGCPKTIPNVKLPSITCAFPSLLPLSTFHFPHSARSFRRFCPFQSVPLSFLPSTFNSRLSTRSFAFHGIIRGLCFP